MGFGRSPSVVQLLQFAQVPLLHWRRFPVGWLRFGIFGARSMSFKPSIWNWKAMEVFRLKLLSSIGRSPRDEELGSPCTVSVQGLFLMQTIACKGDVSHEVIIGDVIGRGAFSMVATLSCLVSNGPPMAQLASCFGACEFNFFTSTLKRVTHPLLLKIHDNWCR